MRHLKFLLPLLMGGFANADIIEYRLVATDITGAQTQIDTNHSTTWSFTLPAAVSWNLKGGTLTMKEGANTTATSQLTLWEGAAGSSQVAQVVLTRAEFLAQVPGSGASRAQSFTEHDYFFSSAYALSGGGSGRLYTLQLTSAANDVQSQAYFIKGRTWQFEDQDGNPLPPGNLTGAIGDSGSSSAAPEPGPVLLIASGLIAVVVARHVSGKSRQAAQQ